LHRLLFILEHVEEFPVHSEEYIETASTMNASEIIPNLFGGVKASMRELGFVEMKDYFCFCNFPLLNIRLHGFQILVFGTCSVH
jgi:hypothetical protein